MIPKRSRLDLAAGSHVFRRPETLVRQHAQRLDLLAQQMAALLTAAATAARRRLDAATPRMARATQAGVHDAKVAIGSLDAALTHAAKTRSSEAGHRLATAGARLDSVNPMAVLARGYGLVRLASGAIVTRAAQVASGDVLSTRMQDGEIASVVAGGARRRRAAKAAEDATQLTLL